MYGKTISALVILILLALGVGAFVWQTTAAAGKNYKNSVYGYSLTYPSDLDVKEYGDDMAAFGVAGKDAFDARVEARVVTAQGEPGQTLQDAVADQLKNYCAADGPSSSFSCTDTISTEPFTTELGEQGFILTLQGQLKDVKSGTITPVPKGPYYVLTLATSATISKVVVIEPPLNQSAAEANPTLIKMIAESLRLQK